MPTLQSLRLSDCLIKRKPAIFFLLIYFSLPGLAENISSNPDITSNNLSVWLEINGPIGPATVDYFQISLEKAREKNADLVVIKMDTPGGLDTSMREIIKAILSSQIPVVTYVSPSGARAASAGTYILYASHIAAMAPGTNLGAATPVNVMGSKNPLPGLDKKFPGNDNEFEDPDDDETSNNSGEQISGDAMAHKVINDATAYLRSLAQLRGRNEEWAVQAIHGAESLPAKDALAMKVIDLIAVDDNELLKKIHGRTVKVGKQDVVLNTTDLSRENIKPDWRNKFLMVVTNPTVAYVLVLIGLYGLFFEFSNPGAIVPGVVGGVALILALYAFQMLPVNYAGLGLMLLGLILIITEAIVPSFGALGIGGVIAFTVGSVILMDTDIPGYGVPLALIASISLTTAGIFLAIIVLLFKARRRPVISGQEELVNSTARALMDFDKEGAVMIHGERWNARSNSAVKQGDELNVDSVDGLTLLVTPAIDDKGE